ISQSISIIAQVLDNLPTDSVFPLEMDTPENYKKQILNNDGLIETYLVNMQKLKFTPRQHHQYSIIEGVNGETGLSFISGANTPLRLKLRSSDFGMLMGLRGVVNGENL